MGQRPAGRSAQLTEGEARSEKGSWPLQERWSRRITELSGHSERGELAQSSLPGIPSPDSLNSKLPSQYTWETEQQGKVTGQGGLPLPALTLGWKQLIKSGSQRRRTGLKTLLPRGSHLATDGGGQWRPLPPPLERSAGLCPQQTAAGNTGHGEAGAGVGKQPQITLREPDSAALKKEKKKKQPSHHICLHSNGLWGSGWNLLSPLREKKSFPHLFLKLGGP